MPTYTGTEKISDQDLKGWTIQDFNDILYEISTEKEIAAYVQNKDVFIEEAEEEP